MVSWSFDRNSARASLRHTVVLSFHFLLLNSAKILTGPQSRGHPIQPTPGFLGSSVVLQPWSVVSPFLQSLSPPHPRHHQKRKKIYLHVYMFMFTCPWTHTTKLLDNSRKINIGLDSVKWNHQGVTSGTVCAQHTEDPGFDPCYTPTHTHTELAGHILKLKQYRD
jgi:hypothetical protein